MSYTSAITVIAPSDGEDFNVLTLTPNKSTGRALQAILLVPSPGSSPLSGTKSNQWRRIGDTLALNGYEVVCMIPPGKAGYLSIRGDGRLSDGTTTSMSGAFSFTRYANDIKSVLGIHDKHNRMHIVTSSLGQIPTVLALGDELNGVADDPQRKVIIGAPIYSLSNVLDFNFNIIDPKARQAFSNLDIIWQYATRYNLTLDMQAIEQEIKDRNITGPGLHRFWGSVMLGCYGNIRDSYMPQTYRDQLIDVPDFTFNDKVSDDPSNHEFTQNSADVALKLILRFLETGTFHERKTLIERLLGLFRSGK